MGKGNDPNCSAGIPMPDPSEGADAAHAGVWRSDNAQVLYGRDGDITVRYDAFEVRGTGKVDVPTGDDVQMSIDEEGYVEHTATMTLLHLNEGVLISANGAETLDAGTYAITGQAFQRMSAAPSSEQPARSRPLPELPSCSWNDLSAHEQTALQHAYWAFSRDEFSPVFTSSVQSERDDYYHLSETDRRAHDQHIQDGLRALAERGLMHSWSNETWEPTPAGELLLSTPWSWPQVSGEHRLCLELLARDDAAGKRTGMHRVARMLVTHRPDIHSVEQAEDQMHALQGWGLVIRVDREGKTAWQLTDAGRELLATRPA